MIDLSTVTDIKLGGTPVEQITDSQNNLLWSAAPIVLLDYFYVEDISGSDSTLSIIKTNANAPSVGVYMSTDRINWASMGTTDTTAITATIPANGKLYLRANINKWGNSGYYNKISVTGNHNVGGNIMSLLYGNRFVDKTSILDYSFTGLFNGDTKLVNANDLILPATTMRNNCYDSMFQGCSSLITTPVLSATALAYQCYSSMFSGCSSLTTAPALPATTLESACYAQMFQFCTALTTAPVLPATTLATHCYSAMFQNCRALTTAPALPATTLTDYCYANMFNGCSALTTAPALPATTLTKQCYNCMFMGCSALTTAPALPATTLTNQCYYWMFKNSTNLSSVTTYATDISASNCLHEWLDSVAATGDFYNMGGATYTSGASGIPTGWTEHTPSVPINVTIINTDSYTGATYQIDSETAQPVNVTGNTTFTVPTTATTLTVNRNGKGETSITGVSGMNTDTEFVVVIPVQDMSSNVTIEFISLM